MDAAIKVFHLDTGEYPETLDELLQRPERFSSTTADNWPYIKELTADPWQQSYRYTHPGKFNPGGCDVYSVHGNSREPSVWIGNWPSPYRTQGALEGEELEIHAKSQGVSASKQEVGVASFPPLSQGHSYGATMLQFDSFREN